MLAAFHVSVDRLRLGFFGAAICASGTRRLSYARELAVTLAGPAVNLLAAPLLAAIAARCAWPLGYLLAGAHVLLGVYNLLPIPPLDGAQALYLLVAWRWGPSAGAAAAFFAGCAAALALVICGGWLTFRHGGALFLLAALGLLAGAIRDAAKPLQKKTGNRAARLRRQEFPSICG